jgi:hypothetical protein
MGFEITPQAAASRVRVFIDYAKPDNWTGRVLGFLFARIYGRWCVQRVVDDAVRAFGSAA